MKTRFTHQALSILTFAAVPFLHGCTEPNAEITPTYVTTSTAPPVVTQVLPTSPTIVASSTSPEPVSSVPPAAAPPLILSNAAATADAGPAVPPNLRISRPLNEVIKLAQSGVDETVILAYVTNSPAVFTLGAEEIVYLNDLGVANSVTTAMIQHDQALKSAWANAAPAVAPVIEQPVAAAPTYVNPPTPAPAVESQPVYVSDNYFSDTLSPYGTWVEVDGYGRCWRPTVAISSSDWQPYRDRGRWVHTDAGWYWMSDYSWGSVAFHYGRWFSHPRWGWCWWPDTVWAPSWVTWRYDNDNCGWAPLPPRSYFRPGTGFYFGDRAVGLSFDFGLNVGLFTFVPWGRFCDPYPYRYCLSRPRSVAIYNQTTVINNLAVGNNNRIINRGIALDRVREHTHTEIRTVSLRDENVRNLTPRQERFERDGRTLVVQRPQDPPAGVAASRPTVSRRDSGGGTATRANGVILPRPTAPIIGRSTPNNGNDRIESRPARDPETRASDRAVIPNRNTSPAGVIGPVAPTTPSGPATTIRPQQPRQPDNSANHNRPGTATVIRTPPTTPTPTPVRTPTPIFSKPVVAEGPAYTPTRQIEPSPVLDSTSSRGGRLNGRDNQVVNPPAQPVSTAPTSAPGYRGGPARNQSNFTPENSPQIQSPAPVPSAPSTGRPNDESRNSPNRNNPVERSAPIRPVDRNSAPTFSTPSPRSSAPVIAPTSAPAPSPRPSYTPPPAPAPRVESQPARVEPARTEPRTDSKTEPSRPGRSR